MGPRKRVLYRKGVLCTGSPFSSEIPHVCIEEERLVQKALQGQDTESGEEASEEGQREGGGNRGEAFRC